MEGFSIKPIKADSPDSGPKLSAVEKMFNEEFRRHYKVVDKIGHGAYANVYKGVHIESSTPVAIKYMKDIEYSLSYLLAELKLLQYLKHKNISRLYDIIPAERTEEERMTTSGKVVPSGRITGVYVVLELMETDLKKLYGSPTTFNEA